MQVQLSSSKHEEDLKEWLEKLEPSNLPGQIKELENGIQFAPLKDKLARDAKLKENLMFPLIFASLASLSFKRAISFCQVWHKTTPAKSLIAHSRLYIHYFQIMLDA